MKALTLTEPWATLVALGAKCIETRSWSTKYRGPLAIHAAKGMPSWAEDQCYEDPFFSVLREHFSPAVIRRRATAWFERGSVIATCTLVDVLPIVSKPSGIACVAPDEEGLMRAWSGSQPFADRAKLQVGDMTTEHEAAFGDYTPGRFGWVLSDVKRLAVPIQARGALGLWEWEQPS